jgi:hypothetical protein
MAGREASWTSSFSESRLDHGGVFVELNVGALEGATTHIITPFDPHPFIRGQLPQIRWLCPVLHTSLAGSCFLGDGNARSSASTIWTACSPYVPTYLILLYKYPNQRDRRIRAIELPTTGLDTTRVTRRAYRCTQRFEEHICETKAAEEISS